VPSETPWFSDAGVSIARSKKVLFTKARGGMHIGSVVPFSHFFGMLSFVSGASAESASFASSSDGCGSSPLADFPSPPSGEDGCADSDFIEGFCDALADRAPAAPRDAHAQSTCQPYLAQRDACWLASSRILEKVVSMIFLGTRLECRSPDELLTGITSVEMRPRRRIRPRS
jgi:hypothetical protein